MHVSLSGVAASPFVRILIRVATVILYRSASTAKNSGEHAETQLMSVHSRIHRRQAQLRAAREFSISVSPHSNGAWSAVVPNMG